MQPELAIFDCDGTLADSEASIVDAVAAAFAEHELEYPGREAIVAHIGLSLGGFLGQVAPGLAAARQARILDSYRDHFARLREERGVDPLFPGIGQLLTELHEARVLLGVATGKSRRGLMNFLDAHQLTGLFSTLQTADDAPSKPHPAMVLRALDETGTRTDRAVMIGDTTFDMGAAVNAGVTAIGVEWGHHSRPQLLGAGADWIARDASELRRGLFAPEAG